MNTSLRVLRYVVAVAEKGQVTEAANSLGVSQPSVSSAMADLEAAVGVQIFVRHHARGVTLTAAGEKVVREARLLLNHAEDFFQNAEELGVDLKGEITVGCFQTLAVRFLPRLLSEFTRIHSGISVKLFEGDHEELLEMLLSGRSELVISYDFGIPMEVEAVALCELPPYVIIAADHRLAKRSSVHLRELENEPFILMDLPHSKDYFAEIFRIAGTVQDISFKSRSYELIRGLVAQGHGFAIQNAIPATRWTYDGSTVATLPILDPVPPVKITLMRLRHHNVRPAVRAFADFLHTEFGASGMFRPGSIQAPPVGRTRKKRSRKGKLSDGRSR